MGHLLVGSSISVIKFTTTNTSTTEMETRGAEKSKVVVIMGPTGAGKSKLAIDLATHFPIEIINADSMQVYQGIDVLSNKVSLPDQNGVPHHLLGTVSPNVEFTAKTFRDAAIPLIDEIISRNHVPVIAGGTNYYIQALVSPLLLCDNTDCPIEDSIDCFPGENMSFSYDLLKNIDPIAASRLHPNNTRKIKQYLDLYNLFGVIPSKIYQGKASENWGSIEQSRYECCFICVDADASVLDNYVDSRVNSMVDSDLFGEVFEIYSEEANYTRGLRQAIGVREFKDLLQFYFFSVEIGPMDLQNDVGKRLFQNTMKKLYFSDEDSQIKMVIDDGINQLKLNTRRLVRRQKRMINRLRESFGWNIHVIDVGDFLSGKSMETWDNKIVKSAAEIVKSFYEKSARTHHLNGVIPARKDIWTEHTCQICDNRVLRGDHEWEQHIKGKHHRKRFFRLRKLNIEKGFLGND